MKYEDPRLKRMNKADWTESLLSIFKEMKELAKDINKRKQKHIF